MPRKKSSTGKDRAPKTQAGGDPVLPAVNPATDDYAAPPDSAPFPIVAIGASAGGLEACNALLAAVPHDTGMAFVVVQHLSPTHESLLADILQRSTKLSVQQVENNMEVEPNHVYVIPPGKHLVLAKGLLHLGPRIEVRGQQRPIDHFMRSLAEEHGHKSIGVVLSGTANDGSLGIQEIKAAGGITFAQDATAEQPSMPRSAIATGAVDFVLPPDEIGRELGRVARHPYVSPALDAGALALNESSMQRILGILRHGTGVDFDGYKRNTLNRRITRRMVLHKLENLQDYVRYLQNNAEEVDALYQDVLINVTSFFRNPEAYEALKTSVFPRLTENRSRHDQVRIWALGCSTGEEAYSIAMTFVEYAEASGRHMPAQIFATDLNGAGIDRARAGVYTKGIVEDVSAERLRRFFVEVDGSYRISKPIRDMCVFARQNVLADPPFSRLDLVACRNLLIYLDGSLQQRIIPMLHYALRASGYLWLGGSETIGSYRELFDVVDTKHKIYSKRPGSPHPVAVPVSPPPRWDPNRGATHAAPATARPTPGPDPQREADRLLLARYAPPSVVVNDELDILQFRGDTSPFLMPAPGRASLNLLKMLREGLIVAVRGAITRARRENKVAREDGLRVRSNGGWREVSVEVVPIKGGTQATSAFMIVFEEAQASLEARTRQLYVEAQADISRVTPSDTDAKEVIRLKQELGATREYLQSVIEQQEAANEELQSANEEVQSANEELQSINEELETSKEEIQSSNEELATVNDELQNRNLELSQSNNDLTNLVASVQIAIVMVGRDLRIRRFTPAAERLFNLIPGDIGRPLGDIKLNINMPDLDKMVIEVIETISIREREIQDRAERWYSLRVRPYRTLENVIDGAVIVLVDIDDMKKAEHALRESEQRFEMMADSAPVLIWMTDQLELRFVNRAFEDFVGALESEIRKTSLWRFVHPDDRAGFESDYLQAVRDKRQFESRARFRRSDGEHRWMKTVGTPRMSEGHLIGFVGGTFDITDMQEAEAALLELDRSKNEFLAVLAHELRNPLSGVRNASRLLSDASDPRVVGQAREIIDRQTGNMVRMIDDLLDVSRVTHGKIQLQREPVDLVALVRRTAQSTAHERDASQQTITLSLPEHALWINADPLRIDQIVANLLNNASKFTRAGGRIWLSVEREPGPRNEPAMATIRVRDNGVGIEPAVLPRIFELFVQGDRSTARTRTGMGLGLTLAKRLAELHGGTVEAFSAGNALGSEFVVRIPTISDPQVPRVEKQVKRGMAARRYRLLVVDDDRDSAESLRLMLAMAGHEVASVHRGEEAVEKAAAFRADAILLDIGLPDMDGYDVARALRKDARTRDAMIIAVTGYGRREDIENAHAAGVDGHMTKPIDPDALMALVERGRKPAKE